jgi:phosphoglycerate dehydrogenase-like enzyme
MPWAYRFTAQELASDPGIVVVQCDSADTHKELLDADVAVPLMTPLPDTVLFPAKRLKMVIQYGAGVNAVDAAACTRLGIWLSNIPTQRTPNALSCAEHAIFLTLAALRQHNAMLRSVVDGKLGAPLGQTLFGKTVLVVGFSGIGQELVPRLAPFGAIILGLRGNSAAWGSDPQTASIEALLSDRGGWPTDALRLAATADVVILACELNSSTRGMLGKDFLSHCKDGVIVVNVARGGLMDKEALLEGLASGRVGGVATDVLDAEPAAPGDELANHPLVYVTPHIAGVTEPSCEKRLAGSSSGPFCTLCFRLLPFLNVIQLKRCMRKYDPPIFYLILNLSFHIPPYFLPYSQSFFLFIHRPAQIGPWAR